MCVQNFAAQMAGGFDEKAGGAQMGVMQGPMVRKNCVHRHIYMYIKYLLKLCEIQFSVNKSSAQKVFFKEMIKLCIIQNLKNEMLSDI